MSAKLIAAQSIPIWAEEEITPYSLACAFFSGRLVRDRFNYLNQYSSFDWYDVSDGLANSTNSVSSLLQIMDERAANLIKEGSIAVQWSGGVDSTALLLALIKNGINKNDLTILCDSNSVAEYPKLYLWLQEQNYSLVLVKDWRDELASVDTDIITNGWCADQLFGSVFFNTAKDMYSKTMKELLTSVKLPWNTYATEDQAEEAIEVYKKAGKDLFDIDLNLACELGWFINFTCKWTWVSTFNELYLAGTKNQNKTKVFYDTSEFQAWSINNFPNISSKNMYGADASNYKRELKGYCNEIFPDEEFLQRKGKNPSWNGRENASMFKKLRVTFKTTEGIDIVQLPRRLPKAVQIPSFYKDFFTRYKK